MAELYGSDAFSPGEIADKVENVGVKKAELAFIPMFAFGVLAGGFIGLGALYYFLEVSDPEIGFGMGRILGGIVFSLGLILVVIAGAELFTGNNLIPVTLGNLVGGTGMVGVIYWIIYRRSVEN